MYLAGSMLQPNRAGVIWQQPVLSSTTSEKPAAENLKICIGHDELVLDSNAYKRDIDEFFSYTELPSRLHDFQCIFQQELEQKNMQLRDKKLASYFLDRFASEDQSVHLHAAKCLAYFALGEYSLDNDQKDEQSLISRIMSNNRTLYDLGALDVLFTQLELIITNKASDESTSTDLLNVLMTIAYLIIDSNSHRADIQDGKLASIVKMHYIKALVKCIAKFADFLESFPLLMKKLFLLLNKTLLICLGSVDEAKDIKEYITKLHGLKLSTNENGMKADLTDILNFYDDIKGKYTACPTPDIPFSSTVVRGDMDLTIAMGLLWAASQTELPYILRFPPKAKSKSTNGLSRASTGSEISAVRYKKELEKMQSTTPFEHGTPKAILEAREIFASHLHLPFAEYQLYNEREKAVKQGNSADAHQDRNDIRNNGKAAEKLDAVETIYASVFEDLSQFVNATLKELVKLANIPVVDDSIKADKDATTLRDCEISRAAISSTLLLLLKWFKLSHVLKFEYFAQLLVDHGYLLLATRMLALEDLRALRTRKTDNDSQEFFSHTSTQSAESFNSVSSSSSLASTSSWVPSDYCSEDDVGFLPFISTRNETWLIDTLRILQMLSKGKKLRCKILAQYKFWIPVKRICNAMPDSTAESYALGLLKEQITYLGLKWRSSHIKLVSAVARRCPPRLRDEWLVCKDGEEGEEEERLSYSQEIGTRLLVQIYHGKRYQAEMLPTYDSEKDLSLEELHDAQQQQLEEKEREDEEEDGWPDLDGTVCEDDRWDVGTPIPSYQPPPSADALTVEINKLYHEQVKKTAKNKNESDAAVLDGWDAPASLTPTVRNKTFTSSDEESDDDEAVNNSKDDDDPLQNIDWTTLTEEELMDRLNKVKETTVQRWLNVDLDDPSHCKVLNAIEGLYIDSETGEGGVTPAHEPDESNTWL